MRRIMEGILAASLLAVVACGGDSEGDSTPADPATTGSAIAATASPSSTPPPAEATATRTPTPAPSATPTSTRVAPTETPVPPTETPVPPTEVPVPPTEVPAPTQPPPPSGGAQTLYLTAQTLKFSPTTLYALAGGTVTIVLTNNDNFVPHNVSVTGYETSNTCSGPCTATTAAFATPPRGSYGFICTVHPYMAGTLVVQ